MYGLGCGCGRSFATSKNCFKKGKWYKLRIQFAMFEPWQVTRTKPVAFCERNRHVQICTVELYLIPTECRAFELLVLHSFWVLVVGDDGLPPQICSLNATYRWLISMYQFLQGKLLAEAYIPCVFF